MLFRLTKFHYFLPFLGLKEIIGPKYIFQPEFCVEYLRNGVAGKPRDALFWAPNPLPHGDHAWRFGPTRILFGAKTFFSVPSFLKFFWGKTFFS